MRKILIFSGIALTGLAVLAAIGFGWLFKTGSGRDFIIGQLEPQIEKALGGEARIGVLEGAPPSRIVIRDVVLSHSDDPWLTFDEATLVWSPLSLLTRKISVDLTDVSGLSLLALPPERPQDNPEAPPKGFELPSALPHVSVKKLTLSEIYIAPEIAGRPVTLNGAGALNMGGRALSTTFDGQTADGKDAVRWAVDIDAAANKGAVALEIFSDDDGIAQAARLDGPLKITVVGDGPLDNLVLTIDGEAGALGGVVAKSTFSGKTGARRAALAGTLNLGPAFAALAPTLGDTVAFDAEISERDNGANIVINEMSSRAGRLIGSAGWRNQRGVLAEATTDAVLTLSAQTIPALTTISGEKIALKAALERNRDGFTLNANLSGDGAALALEEVQTDLSSTLKGPLTLELKANTEAPELLRNGVRLTGYADIDVENAASLSRLEASLGGQSVFDGAAQYRFEDGDVNARGAVRIPTKTASLLLPSYAPQGAITGDIAVTGTVDNFRVNLRGDAPSASLNDQAIPPIRATADIGNLPSRPAGEFMVSAENANGQLKARIDTAADGLMTVRDILYAAENFELKGDAAFNPENGAARLDLTYKGEEGATPAPRLPLEGTAVIKGALSAGGAAQLELMTDRLASSNFAVEDLSIVAAGPAEAIDVKAQAATILVNGADPITALQMAATVRNAQAPTARLTELALRYGNVPVTLSQSADFAFGDGVAVSNLKAAIGGNGLLAADAAFSKTRWRADITVNDVPVRAAAGFANLAFILDTDKKEYASGTFGYRPDTAETEDTELGGVFTWTQGGLAIRDNKAVDALSVDVILPLMLKRSPSLTAAINGAIDGSVAYDGKVTDIAGYLPDGAQGLEGLIDISLALGGTLEAPEIEGRAALRDGAYTELASGVSLENISANAEASVLGETTQVAFSGGASGAGQAEQSILLKGNAQIGGESALNAVITMNEAQISALPIVTTKSSGEIRIAGPLNALKATGEIIIDQIDAEIVTPEATGLVDITVVADSAGEQPTPLARPVTQASAPFDLTIKVSADDKIFVRGRGLESEWRTDVTVTTSRDTPIVIGSVNLRRGVFDFSGRRFEITKGVLSFDRLSANNPVLDIVAAYGTQDDVTARIVVSGRAQSPSIELESSPSLPKEDVMALVLFGKPATELSAIESLQMAQALAQLGGVGPFGGGGGVAGAARGALGLDLLNVDFDSETGGSALTVGKYVADGLFVSATQDVRGENGSVRVEYEIRDNITVETELNQNGDQTVSANWKRDF